MDRLRKCRENLHLKVRKFIRYNWHNEPEDDKFRSLDMLFVLGAIRFKPTLKWQRICWNVYCVTSVCSFIILALNALETIPGEFELTSATWHSTLVLATGLCFVKDLTLNREFESMQIAREFINGKHFGSVDSAIQMSNDAACRKKLFQRVQLVALAMLLVIIIDQIIFNAPISGINEFFGTPQVLQYLGPTLVKGIAFVFLFGYSPLWASRYCDGTVFVCALLYGFNTEYEIYVRNFDSILDNVYSDVEEKLPSTFEAAPERKRFRRDQLYWKFLEQRINDQVKLHVQLVENMQLLEPVVNHLFAIIYYSTMVYLSPVLYVLVTNGLSGASLIMVSAITVVLLECYMWCHIIDSLKDTNEKLELKIMDLMANIPYSEFHRKKYAEMRTTLCILKTFVRNHEPFSCGDVFPISVEAFAELMNIGYTVFTFLRDVGQKE